MGKGGPMAFLNKKAWHPGRVQNQEEVWKREQAASKEDQKMKDLQKQIAEERAREEMMQVAEAAGVKVRSDRLDWMYQGCVAARQEADQRQAAADTTLGAGGSKTARDEQQEPGLGGRAGAVAALPSFYSEDTPASANEMWQRLHADPLFAIKQQEVTARRTILSNPVQMQAIKAQVKQLKGGRDDASSEEDDRGKRHRHRHGDRQKDRKKDKKRKKERKDRSRSRSPKREKASRRRERDDEDRREGGGKRRPEEEKDEKRERGREERDHSYRRRNDRSRTRSRTRSRSPRRSSPVDRRRDRDRREYRRRSRSRSPEDYRRRTVDDRREERNYRRGDDDRRDNDRKERKEREGDGPVSEKHQDDKGDKRPEVHMDGASAQGAGAQYGITYGQHVPDAVRNQDRSHLGEATRKRLEEAARRKEQEEQDAAAERNRRRREQQHRPGRLTEEERLRRLQEMAAAANEHDAQRHARIEEYEKIEAKEEIERQERGGNTETATFLQAATKDVYGAGGGGGNGGGAGSLADAVGRRKAFQQRGGDGGGSAFRK